MCSSDLAALLARFPDTVGIPEPPEFERRKRPADVYGRLLKVFEHLEAVADRSNIKMLAFDGGDLRRRAVPSDVYDIASILISELAYLHSRLKNPPEVAEAYDPCFKIPADVYQLAVMLLTQMDLLDNKPIHNPDSLDH